MPDRKEVTYTRLFDMLLEAYPALRPHAVCLDFEVALINCVKVAFPDARLSACYFHLSQVVIRHLAGDLKRAYETELEFSIDVRMIFALAFVPGTKLIEYFNALKQVIDARLTPLVDYFEGTYVGQFRIITHLISLSHHPHIWRFINAMHSVQRTFDFDFH